MTGRINMTRAIGILAVAFVSGLVVIQSTRSAEPPNDSTAKNDPLVKNMDRKADPRKDFYRYAAGGWLDQAKIEASKSMASPMTNLKDGVNRR